MDDAIRARLERIRNIPTLPENITRLRTVVRDPQSDASRVARVLEDDPTMSARILRVVNSAFYAGLEPITDLRHAVVRIGFNAVVNIALSTAIFSLFDKSRSALFDRKAFWRHCVATGIGLVVLSRQTDSSTARRYSVDVLHLAGVLHDIGKILLDEFFHEPFLEACRLARERAIPLQRTEAEVLHADHAEVGMWLGQRWNLTPEYLDVIRWHHAPEDADSPHASLILLCGQANALCNRFQIGNSGNPAPVDPRDIGNVPRNWLPLTPETCETLAAEIAAYTERSELLNPA